LTSQDLDINYGLKFKLLTEEDILRASLGEEFRLNITETARRVFRGLKRIRFLNRLRLAANLMREVKAHYRSYPEVSEDFEEWRVKAEALFKEAKSKIME